MKYLLDTCIISELVKPVPNAQVTNWLEGAPSNALFLSVLTIGEVRKGLVKLPDSKKKEQLTLWLNTLLEEYNERIIPIDLTVAENWGTIQGNAEKAGTPMSTIDGLISAMASTYNLILVTRNESDFTPAQIPLINPWKVKNLGKENKQKEEETETKC
ncbi:MAG: PIN domain-containing protein [Candidatus Aminicenantes bacterium]|nr:PIN domain-containing protein [Candidatus Aminicenantes bacterium]NIM83812.1 PIN domain-containing protein [Candidatus Aminicenantes bacterium]NIN23262.1 PIN domain-containing protein [Candidatus Aminicenantes bacterium]NIN46966.1 PIN domain-containing protein [Candidatus Aminicenantes bacterium]NIN89888.1 PIN domain-containing protein [Candidatus Aminicenantes bacterium]